MESLYVERCLKAHFTNYSWKVVFDESDRDKHTQNADKKRIDLTGEIEATSSMRIPITIENTQRERNTEKKPVYLDDVFEIDWLRPKVFFCVRCMCTLVTFFASSNVHFLWVCCAFWYIYFFLFLSISFVCLSSAPFLMHL